MSATERIQSPESINQALKDMLRISTNITSLSLDMSLDEDSVRILLQFPRLDTIRCMRITHPAVFVNLLSQPRLTSLDLGCAPLTMSAVSQKLPRTLRSVHLVELSLNGSCATFAPLFTALRAPSLRRSSFTFFCWNYVRNGIRMTAKPADYVTCMSAFAAAAPALEELSMGLPGRWRLSLGELLAPVLPLRNIRRFTYGRGLNTVCHTGVDADFAAVARAWCRSLEVLRFEPANFFWMGSGPIPSAASVSYLRASCPRLVDLNLPPLDPSLDKLITVDIPVAEAHAHPLDTLRIRLWKMKSTDITDEMRGLWEAYLMCLFPKLVHTEESGKLVVGERDLPHQSTVHRVVLSES